VASRGEEFIDGDGVRRGHWHSRGLPGGSAAATRREWRPPARTPSSRPASDRKTCAAVLGGAGVASPTSGR
jgi:hypothetical protein